MGNTVLFRSQCLPMAMVERTMTINLLYLHVNRGQRDTLRVTFPSLSMTIMSRPEVELVRMAPEVTA